MAPPGFYTQKFAKNDGKTGEGGGGTPPFFPLSNVTYLSLVSQPMARDPFSSIKPSHSTFPFHSSLQASKQSKQASKQARMSSNTYGYR